MLSFCGGPQDNLDQRTTYELLDRHGRDELTLYFASTVGDHERIVRHHIAEQEWTKALQALARQVRQLPLRAKRKEPLAPDAGLTT